MDLAIFKFFWTYFLLAAEDLNKKKNAALKKRKPS